MSALGQKATLLARRRVSIFPLEADVPLYLFNVGFGPNANIGSDPMADVRDVESGKVRATRELFGADQTLNDGGGLRLALQPSLWSASGVRLLRCRGDVTADITKRDWRRLGKRW